jgi:hypothetical protein
MHGTRAYTRACTRSGCRHTRSAAPMHAIPRRHEGVLGPGRLAPAAAAARRVRSETKELEVVEVVQVEVV